MIRRIEPEKSTESRNKTKDKYRQNRQTLFVLAFAVALVMTVPAVFTESCNDSNEGDEYPILGGAVQEPGHEFGEDIQPLNGKKYKLAYKYDSRTDSYSLVGWAIIDANYGVPTGDLVIPSTIMVDEKEKKVTSIGKNAFASCLSIRSVVIPDSIISIDESAFNMCTGITSVYIPGSVVFIGNSAFKKCYNLTTLIFEGIPETLENNCFNLGISYNPVECTVYSRMENEFLDSHEDSNTTFHYERLHKVTIELGGGHYESPSDGWTKIDDNTFYKFVPNGETTTLPGEHLGREGYTFEGWDENVPSAISEDLTFTAQWKINQYTITFDTGGGSTVDTITQDYNSAIKTPLDPTRAGYIFNGWDKTIPNTMPAENITITATWKINQYLVTINLAGGFLDSIPDGWTESDGNYTKEFDYDTPYADIIDDIGTPKKTGHTLNGFNPSEGNLGASDAIITAQWTINQYTITWEWTEDNGVTKSTTEQIDYGRTPSRIGEDYKTQAQVFAFKTWNPAPIAVTEDTTYTATYKDPIPRKYTITFDAQGGTAVNSTTADYGTEVILPGTDSTVKKGHTFKGWSSVVNGDMVTKITLTEDVILYAVWSINQYTIIFDSAGGSSVSSITEKYNTILEDPFDNSEQTGYDFISWTVTDGGTKKTVTNANIWNYVYLAVIEDDVNVITLTAEFKAIEYTVTYETEGTGTAPIDNGKYNMGDSVTLRNGSDLSKTGYTFAGWISDVSGDSAVYEAGDMFTMPASDVKFTAVWTINQYSVTVDLAGGTIATPDGWNFINNVYTKSFNFGTGYLEIQANFGSSAKTGYTFNGFDIEDGLLGVGGATFTAVWIPYEFVIIFDIKGGSDIGGIENNKIFVDFDTEIQWDLYKSVKAGHYFEGWLYNGVAISGNFWESITEENLVDKKVIVTADWDPIEYTISFDTGSEGNAVNPITGYYGTKATAPTDPGRTGYTFNGWISDPTDETTVFVFGEDTIFEENFTLYATWTVNRYSILFEDQDGTLIAKITGDYGTSVTAPADPTREGYEFDGWDSTIPDTIPATDITIKATWKIKQYTISFNSSGGSDVDSITQDYGTSITAPTDPTRTGYSFEGWSPTLPVTMPAGNMTLTAEWKINIYAVIFDEGITVYYDETQIASGAQLPHGTVLTVTAEKTGHTSVVKASVGDITDSKYTLESNVNFTVVWTPIKYAITWKWMDESGKETTATESLDHGTTPTKTVNGYQTVSKIFTFKDWNPTIETVSGDKTYTATYDSSVRKYTIVFDEDDLMVMDESTEVSDRDKIAYDTILTVTAKPKTGHNSSVSADVGTIGTGGTYTVVGDVEFTVEYTAIKYTITFVTDGGTSIPSITQDYGTSVTAPGNPARTGYTFDGWDKTIPSTMPAEDLTITAIWTINKYIIIWKILESDTTAYETTEGVEFGATIVKPTVNPARTGYTFDGWNLTDTTMPANNLVVTADWTINKYTISFDEGDITVMDESTEVSDGDKIAYGTVLTVTAKPKTGHTSVLSAIGGTMGSGGTYIVVEDVEFTVKYTAIKYTINWIVEGTTVQTDEVPYGEIPKYTGDTPVKASAPKFTYTFDKWTPGIAAVIGNTDYTALFTGEINKYTITWEWTEDNGVTKSTTEQIAYGDTPSRTGTGYMTVSQVFQFKEWSPTVVDVEGEAKYTATYKDPVAREYIITWIVDGTEITETYEYGAMPIYKGAEPTKPSTDVYDYRFAGWFPLISKVTGDKQYEAIFMGSLREYNITWNWTDTNGNHTETVKVVYGETPGKSVDDYQTVSEVFEFAEWSPAVKSVVGNAEYTAIYNSEPREYAITWDIEGNQTTEKFTYDSMAKYTGDTPTKASTEAIDFTFSGWSPGLAKVTKDQVYVAQFTESDREYTITWDIEGNQTTEKFTYNATAKYTGDTPTKASTEAIVFTFSGWDPELAKVTKDQVYVAQFSESDREYTITWKVDETVFKTETLEYGKAIVAPTENPTKDSTDEFEYEFKEWTGFTENMTVSGDAVFNADFTATKRSYTITWKVGEDEFNTQSLKYGTTITAPSENPTKDSTDEFEYEFKEWTGFTENMTVSGDAVFNADFTATKRSYTITWVVDGTTVKTEQVSYGTVPVYTGDPPTKALTQEFTYTFDDWTPNVVPVIGNAVYVATFTSTVNKYVITFDTQGGNNIDPITENYNTEIDLSKVNTVKTGHSFKGWSLTDDGDVLTVHTLTDNVTFYAIWEINQYTITLVYDNGQDNKFIKQEYDTSIAVEQNPEKTGYSFDGWDKSIPSTMPAEDITITAQWTINQYTITFNTNGGSDVDNIKQNYGTSVTPPDNPTKTGYTFNCWDEDIPTKMPATDMIITASWKINEYTITFDSAGGTSVSSITQNYGTSVTAPAAPTKTGHTFAHWKNSDGDEVIFPLDMPDGGMTLTAVWTINEYTITLVYGNGDGDKKITQDYETDIAAEPNPEKIGHTFNGWDTDIPNKMPATDMIITAVWSVNPYTITFDSASGTSVSSITQNYGTSITAPADPTRDGYTFDGWDTAIPKTMPAENITITATWKINEYTITWFVDENVHSTTVIEHGDKVTLPTNPQRTGFEFKGWFTSTDYQTEVTSDTSPSSDVSYYACMDKIVYVIQFGEKAGVPTQQVTIDDNVEYPTNPEAEPGYEFAGWHIDDIKIENNSAVSAIINSANIENVIILTSKFETIVYTIIFGSAEGPPTQSATVEDKVSYPEYVPDAPTGKEFLGWYIGDKIIADGSDVAEIIDKTGVDGKTIVLTAKFEFIDCTVTFEDNDLLITHDGKPLASGDKLPYGTILNVTAEKIGHDSEITASVGQIVVGGYTLVSDVEFNVVWSPIKYDINWIVDGNVVKTEKVVYGETPEYTGDIPFRNPTSEFTFTFDKWNPVIVTVTEDADYTALFTDKINEYAVTWKWTEDDGVMKTETELMAYGKIPSRVCDGYKTESQVFQFDTWSPAIVMVTDNIVYTATYKDPTPREYTVIWNWVNSEGNRTESVKMVYGATPIKIIEGYQTESEVFTFKKWAPAVSVVDGDAEYTAIYDSVPRKYILTFDTRGGSAVDSITGDYDASITLSDVDTTRKGYTLKGWSLTVDGNPETVHRLVDDVTLYAVWKINKYTISFVTGVEGIVVGPISGDYGTEVTAPNNPVREGYTFDGWTLKPENEPIVFVFGADTVFEEDFTLYAVWKINEYTITWIVDGETVKVEKVAYGETPEYTGDNPVRTNTLKFTYAFAGWEPEILPVTKDTEYDAVFTETVNEYTVTFDEETITVKDGGAKVSSGDKIAYGIILTITAKSKIGHTLQLSADVGTINENGEYTVKGTVEFIAVYTTIEYKIIWDIGAGDGNPTTSVKYGEMPTYPGEENPVKDSTVSHDYIFSGWNPAIEEVIGEQTYAAEFSKTLRKYTMTFDTKGGTTVDSITADYGTIIPAPFNPAKTGHFFDGWFVGPDRRGVAYLFNEPLTDDVLLYAEWTPMIFTVTFESNGETVKTYDLEYETVITVPEEIPSKNADWDVVYAFAGWSGFTEGMTVSEDITFTAMFNGSPIEYTVTFETGNGSHIEPITENAGTVVKAPVNPIREGHFFGGWTLALTEDFVIFEFGENGIILTGDLTLYAVWHTMSNIIEDGDFALTKDDSNLIWIIAISALVVSVVSLTIAVIRRRRDYGNSIEEE